MRLRSDITDNFRNFKAVNICLSIDAVGKAFDYIRTLGKWTKVKENVQNFIELRRQMPNLNIVAHPTIGSLNILVLDELFDYFQSNDIEYFLGFCDAPRHYSFDIFTPEQQKLILDRLQRMHHSKVNQVINKVKNARYDQKCLTDFRDAVQFTSDYRKLSLKEHLPELDRLINCP